jgi:hypothetical protein
VLPTLRLGDLVVEALMAGVLDMGPAQGPSGFDGILSLGFFDGCAYTVDPAAMTLTIGRSTAAPSAGVAVPLEVRRDGHSVEAFVRLVLPSGRAVLVEVDTGSETLILDQQFLGDCGLPAGSPAVQTTTGTDETGHEWVRHWAVAEGPVHLATRHRSHRPPHGSSSSRSFTTGWSAPSSSTATESPTTSRAHR